MIQLLYGSNTFIPKALTYLFALFVILASDLKPIILKSYICCICLRVELMLLFIFVELPSVQLKLFSPMMFLPHPLNTPDHVLPIGLHAFTLD